MNKNEILEIMKEMDVIECDWCANINDLLDIYTPDEIIKIVLAYEGISGYFSKIKFLFETFYTLQPKTTNEI